MFIEMIGWMGSVLFSLCAYPQAIKSYKDGHSDGLSWYFLLMWFIGEILTLIYVSCTSASLPLLANYLMNLLILLVIIKYKIQPKRKDIK